MRFLTAFPLLLVSLIIYNVLAFNSPGMLEGDLLVYDMMSGATLGLTGGDYFIIGSLILLFLEIIKAARIGTATILDHILSTAVFVAALVEFLLVAQAGTSIFLILVVMCFIDVVAGYTISIRSARRDMNIGHVGDGF